MINAIATANTNLAGFDFGFGAMFPLLAPLLEGRIGEMGDPLHT
jgi:hypothetical protein